MNLSVGTELQNGKYRIIRVLGQGGFGITYLALDVSLDREVAIKEFFPRDYCDREGVTSHVTLGTQSSAQFVNRLKAKFLKEAKNIAKFDHPGIIRIHAAFEENNTAYYVMDFIDGESLSAIVKRDGPLPQEKALKYIGQVAEALKYVHGYRINHLDVKPANIMIRRRDDRPILIDFGLSKQYDSEGNQTSTTPTGISHGFAPIEQYNDGGVREFSPQTDLYSLAASLYYLLSGEIPPHATSLVDNELTFPESIPACLRNPIAKAMSTARRNRHNTIAEFINGLNDDSETKIIADPEPKPKPTPTSEPEPIPEPNQTPKPGTRPNGGTRRRPKKKKISTGLMAIGIAFCIAVIVIIVFITFLLNNQGGGSNDPMATDQDTVVVEAVNPSNTVEGMYYNSSLGACSYTGEVDAEGKPDGKGKAVWESGVAKEYDGQWVHGNMEGDCEYVSRGGYRFNGKFKANHYYEGRLTNPDGSYYEGSFDGNGDKFTGIEYDAYGNQTDSWHNGE